MVENKVSKAIESRANALGKGTAEALGGVSGAVLDVGKGITTRVGRVVGGTAETFGEAFKGTLSTAGKIVTFEGREAISSATATIVNTTATAAKTAGSVVTEDLGDRAEKTVLGAGRATTGIITGQNDNIRKAA